MGHPGIFGATKGNTGILRSAQNDNFGQVSSVEGTSRLFVGVRGWPPGYDDGGDSSRPLLRACDQAICFRRVARRCWMRQSRIVPKWELKRQDSSAARR